MKKYLLAAVAAFALSSSGASAFFEGGNWLLLSLHWENGTGYVYGDPHDIHPEHRPIPSFTSKSACRVSLQHELERHAGLNHAEGGEGAYLCVPTSALALPPWQ